jgi:hypothetical protein
MLHFLKAVAMKKFSIYAKALLALGVSFCVSAGSSLAASAHGDARKLAVDILLLRANVQSLYGEGENMRPLSSQWTPYVKVDNAGVLAANMSPPGLTRGGALMAEDGVALRVLPAEYAGSMGKAFRIVYGPVAQGSCASLVDKLAGKTLDITGREKMLFEMFASSSDFDSVRVNGVEVRRGEDGSGACAGSANTLEFVSR